MNQPPSPESGARAVLVALDGSKSAEAALRPARRLASAIGADVVLLTVVPDSEQTAAAAAYLASLAGGGSAAARTEVRTGRPAAAIAAAAGEPGVALVALTSSGESGDPRHLGGVAERLSRTLPVPALFVPVGYAADPPLAGPLLVALHGSEASETAIEPAAELARALGTRLTLVQVAPWAEGLFANYLGLPPPSADAEIELGSNTYLSALAERLSPRVPADYQTLRGRAANMLVEYAESIGGWLILASHAHNGPHIWGLGSTTDKVLRASRAPVLIIRVEGAGAAAEPLESSAAPPPMRTE